MLEDLANRLLQTEWNALRRFIIFPLVVMPYGEVPIATEKFVSSYPFVDLASCLLGSRCGHGSPAAEAVRDGYRRSLFHASSIRGYLGTRHPALYLPPY